MANTHLILGGCGFIGRHVALLLARRGEKIRLADRLAPSTDFPGVDSSLVEWRQFDLADADWDSLLADVSTVHHYAWSTVLQSASEDPISDVRVNVMGSLALLEAMRRRGSGRIVFASSGGTVYGAPLQVPIPEDHVLAPISAYGAGKLAVENYLRVYRTLHGVDARIARLSNPFGAGYNAGRAQGAVNTFIARAIAGEAITIWGDGTIVRDYIHVSDAAAGLVALADCDAARLGAQAVNIGSGEGVSLNVVIETVQQALQGPITVTKAPGRAFDVPVNVLDISRARAVLGWRPRANFVQGVRRTVEDVLANAGLSAPPA